MVQQRAMTSPTSSFQIPGGKAQLGQRAREAGGGGRGGHGPAQTMPLVFLSRHLGTQGSRVLGFQTEPVLGFAQNFMTQSPRCLPLWPVNDIGEIYYLRWAPFLLSSEVRAHLVNL